MSNTYQSPHQRDTGGRLSRRIATAALAVCAAISLGGCFGAQGYDLYGYSAAEVGTIPNSIDMYPSVYYHGAYAYLLGDTWYYPRDDRWYVFREEPQELARYRTYIVDQRTRYGAYRVPPPASRYPVPAYPYSARPRIEAPPAPRYEAPPAPRYEAPPAPRYTAPPAPRYTAPPAPRYEAPPAPRYEAPPAPRFQPRAPVTPRYEAPPAPRYENRDYERRTPVTPRREPLPPERRYRPF